MGGEIMSDIIEVRVPNIGDFENVEIIEVLVSAGNQIEVENSLIVLESDKATMEIPSPESGTIQEMRVKTGDRVSQGAVILTLEVVNVAAGAGRPEGSRPIDQKIPWEEPAQTPGQSPHFDSPPVGAGAPTTSMTVSDMHAEVLVLGSGPGGYTAAFRAADLGKKTLLVERFPSLGGVCLNVGCIPSKALLHAAKVIAESKEMSEHGLDFNLSNIDIDKLRAWKSGVVQRLTGGLESLARQRKVQVIQGFGRFTSPHQLNVEMEGEKKTISFDQAIIAAGSQAFQIPGFPHDDPRVSSSTGALQLADIPKRLLVVGGGIIGMEMATVYFELGSQITVVELMDSLIPVADKDIVKPLYKRVKKQYENIYLKTKIVLMETRPEGVHVSLEGEKTSTSELFDRVLVAVGRRPNGKMIDAEKAGVRVDQQGFIPVDRQQRSNISHIFAVGDIVGEPMLAHKAIHEGKVAAEVAAGMKSGFEAKVIPSVAYTNPEVAWLGLTETEAKAINRKVGKGVFPWAASGRSLSLGRDEGLTKLIFDEETKQVIGAGIVGPHAGDLIAEVALAIEMGCDAQDIGLTVHPHPTLSETIAMSAEAFDGTITDLYLPKKKMNVPT